MKLSFHQLAVDLLNRLFSTIIFQAIAVALILLMDTTGKIHSFNLKI